jgi:hypothetical protein
MFQQRRVKQWILYFQWIEFQEKSLILIHCLNSSFVSRKGILFSPQGQWEGVILKEEPSQGKWEGLRENYFERLDVFFNISLKRFNWDFPFKPPVLPCVSHWFNFLCKYPVPPSLWALVCLQMTLCLWDERNFTRLSIHLPKHFTLLIPLVIQRWEWWWCRWWSRLPNLN